MSQKRKGFEGPVLFGLGVLLISGAGGFFFLSHFEDRILHPIVICTKMACSKEEPCCNACSHDGWRSLEPVYAEAKGLTRPLPNFPADGCGEVGRKLDATGFQTSGTFYVVSFKEIPLESVQALAQP